MLVQVLEVFLKGIDPSWVSCITALSTPAADWRNHCYSSLLVALFFFLEHHGTGKILIMRLNLDFVCDQLEYARHPFHHLPLDESCGLCFLHHVLFYAVSIAVTF